MLEGEKRKGKGKKAIRRCVLPNGEERGGERKRSLRAIITGREKRRKMGGKSFARADAEEGKRKAMAGEFLFALTS